MEESQNTQTSENEQPAEQPAAQPLESPTPDSQNKQTDKPKKSSKKRVLLIIIAALVLGGGIYGGYYLGHKKTTSTTSGSTSPSTTPDQQKSKKITAESVVYYYKATDKDPYTIYWRPATGGERQSALTLSNKVNGFYYTVSWLEAKGQNVIFSTEDGIYASQDGGKSYKNVYKIDPAKSSNNQAITSLHFSADGKKIVFAFLPALVNGKSSNTVKAMDIDGQNVTDVHTFESAGVFIYNYDTAKQQLVYGTGCFFCDGGPGFPHLLDLKTNKDKQLLSVDDTQILSSVVVSPDGQKLLYYLGTNDSVLASELGGPGWWGGPPYKIMQLDINSGESTQLASFGALHEKSTDGKFKSYDIRIGYTNDTNQPYYTADNKLFTLDGAKASLVFEATKNIWYVPYISSDEIVVGTDNSSTGNADYTLNHYNISSKKTTLIYQGDSNTRLIGVTTK